MAWVVKHIALSIFKSISGCCPKSHPHFQTILHRSGSIEQATNDVNHPLKSWYDPSVNLIKNLKLSIPDLTIQLSRPNKRLGGATNISFLHWFCYNRFRLSPLGGVRWAIRVPEWWSGSLVRGYSIQAKAYRRPICSLVPFNETSLTTPTMAQASSHCQAWSLFWYAFRERTWKVLTLRGTWGSLSVFWTFLSSEIKCCVSHLKDGSIVSQWKCTWDSLLLVLFKASLLLKWLCIIQNWIENAF